MCILQPLMQRKQEHEKRRKEIKEHWIRAKRKLVWPYDLLLINSPALSFYCDKKIRQ